MREQTRHPRADHPVAAALPARAVGRHGLGSELRALRQARSLRLEDVAAKLEVAPSTLSRIETGKAPTKMSYLLRSCWTCTASTTRTSATA